MMKHEQLALFEPPAPQPMPAGFRYAPDLIDAAQEARLVAAFADLPLREFEFHGFLGKRRVVSFGFRYDFNGGGLNEAEPMPPYLLPLRERAAAFAGLAPDRLQHALVTEYRPGTTIGWHRDRPHYDDVIGVSLSSPCTFRMRRKRDAGWERAAIRLDRRSIYLMRGPSRWEWEHSIPPVEELRFSVTFRSMRESASR
ncbi:MAG TPA: alpha-ketoglutarate-dependent dioxygenase AlkB [Xanthobacteraceae bacterium]|nr:alpha-ketoglutarate-dependent dioxygenase AlkB [Xanthobacteraceae bacterium]